MTSGPLLSRAAVPTLLCALLAACGGSSPTTPDPQVTPSPQVQSAYTWYPESSRLPTAEELEVLRLTNEARAKGAWCGATTTESAKYFGPTTSLTWNDQLAYAARNHTQDMAVRAALYAAKHSDFNEYHNTPEGVTPANRVTLAGYSWMAVAENITRIRSTLPNTDRAEVVVSGWLASPSHCRTLMNADYTEMGAGVFRTSDSAGPSYVGYWGQVFGDR